MAYDPSNPTGSKAANQGRSTPTGWTQEAGEVRAQELEFDNGYRVLAVQVLGQKAVIKGPGPWKDFLEHQQDVSKLVEKWLTSIEHETGKEVELPSVPSEERKLDLTPEEVLMMRHAGVKHEVSTERRVRMFPSQEGYNGPRRRSSDTPGVNRMDSLEGMVLSLAKSVEGLRQDLSRSGQKSSTVPQPPQEPTKS